MSGESSVSKNEDSSLGLRRVASDSLTCASRRRLYSSDQLCHSAGCLAITLVAGFGSERRGDQAVPGSYRRE